MPAIPFDLLDTCSKRHTLTDYRGSWLLMVFHRHLAWLPCREHVLQLQQANEEIERRNLKILIVTFENLELAKHYVESTNLIWPLLLDTERKLYRAYEMERGGFWSIFGPASWWGYLKLLFRGRKIKKPTDDVRQLGGDVLIDPEGEVRLHFVSKKPVDRPLISTILDLIP